MNTKFLIGAVCRAYALVFCITGTMPQRPSPLGQTDPGKWDERTKAASNHKDKVCRPIGFAHSHNLSVTYSPSGRIEKGDVFSQADENWANRTIIDGMKMAMAD